MKFKTYDKYEESKTKWLNEKPKGWRDTKVKFVSKFVTGWTPSSGNEDYYGGDYYWANISDMKQRYISETEKTLSDLALKEINMKPIPPYSLLFSFKLSVGNVAFNKTELYTNEAIATFLKNETKENLEYLFYAYPLYIVQNSNHNIYGALILNQDLIKNAQVTLPDINIQNKIVKFVNRYETKINKTIELYTKYIDLLKEKRVSLISHTVTKGLDKSVELKDSGVDWIGKIPKGWNVKLIKRMCYVSRGASPRPIDDDIYFDENGEYAWVRIADVTASEMFLEKTEQRLSSIGKKYSVPMEPGDLFLSIAGSVGKPILTKIKCCIHDGFVYFKRLDQNRKYWYYIFASEQAYKGLGKMGTQLNLNTEIVGTISFPEPPPSEQKQIAEYLDKETSKIDTLINKIEKQIDLLREYKSSLITHAVTGKIDVSDIKIKEVITSSKEVVL